MTSVERMSRLLKREKTDRIGLLEHFWSDTYKTWIEQGHLSPGESLPEHFGFDMELCWAFDLMADLDKPVETISETETTVVQKDGNGATLRRHKHHDTTPEHVDFSVKEGKDWDELIKPLLKPDERRINFEAYAETKRRCSEGNKFFAWSGVNVFECMHPVCGHENLLAGMALEPEWVSDMAETYADLQINLMETLFAKCGKPDGIWFYEDLGFKQKPFISPNMYKELILPYHKKTIDFAHSLNLPVIMHSCGFIEPLLPFMVEAGIDCLQAIEIKAGMDLLRIFKSYADVLSLMGGIDVRALYSNDKAIIDKELAEKIPIVKQGLGYTLHSDHSIPKTVEYDTYKYFIDKAMSL